MLDFVYAKAELPREQIRKVRLQIKEKTSASGDRQLGAERDRKVVWYEPDELSSYFDTENNKHKIEQLGDSGRVQFKGRAGEMLTVFGYNMNNNFNREE